MNISKKKNIMNMINDKKNRKIIIYGVCIFIFIFFVLIVSEVSKFVGVTNPDASVIKEEYESLNDVTDESGKKYLEVKLPSNNILRYSDVNEITNIFKNNGNGVVYFGFSTCLYCRSAIEVLCDEAKDTKLDKIYYLDTSKVEDYGELLGYLNDKFLTEEKNNVYSPLVIFVVRGQIVSYAKGTLFSQDDPYVELDGSQREGLGEIYRYGIRDVLDGKKKYGV